MSCNNSDDMYRQLGRDHIEDFVNSISYFNNVFKPLIACYTKKNIWRAEKLIIRITIVLELVLMDYTIKNIFIISSQREVFFLSDIENELHELSLSLLSEFVNMNVQMNYKCRFEKLLTAEIHICNDDKMDVDDVNFNRDIQMDCSD